MIVVSDNDIELFHHGTKGMRWGIRRYQNPDGSLTPEGRKRYMNNPRWRAKYLKIKKKQQDEAARTHESKEARRKRLLESTDANELYKHRKDLSTQELQERINRIQTEQNLAKYMTHEPTKMEKAKAVADKLISAGNDVYKFSQTPAGKAVVKSIKRNIGIGEEPKAVDYKRELKRMNFLSNDEVQALANRLNNERRARQTAQEIESMLDRRQNRNNNQQNNNNNNNQNQQNQNNNNNNQNQQNQNNNNNHNPAIPQRTYDNVPTTDILSELSPSQLERLRRLVEDAI